MKSNNDPNNNDEDSEDKPLYVVNINADNNTIIVGAKEFLEIKEIKLRDLNLLGNEKDFFLISSYRISKRALSNVS